MLGPTRLPRHIRIAAVGTTTGSAAQRQLRRVDYIANGGTATKLADELIDRMKGTPKPTLLLILAENAPAVLEDKLEAAGHTTVRVDVYRTIAAPEREERQSYSSLGCDAVFLASPSAVTGFINQVEFDVEPEIYTIGPSTTAAVEHCGLQVVRQASEPSLKGLLEAKQCLN
jgi:uroporphyrinogen-III synthase